MNTNSVRQVTLRGAATLAGVGVHSGAPASITVGPGAPGTGYVFTRRGAMAGAEIAVDIDNLGSSELCTTLFAGGWSVATVEHLLAALSGLEIDNASIEVEGGEVPAMDGSASAFVEAIDRVGAVMQNAPRRMIRVLRPFRVELGQAFAEVRPYEGRRIEIELDYANGVIGKQHYAADISPAIFRAEIAPARTFGFLQDVEALRKRGLARGASLDNALVIGDRGLLNPEGLRFADEFARHKAIDALGDLALAGAPILGCYRSYRGGHTLNARMVAALLATAGAYEWVEARPRVTRHVEIAQSLEPELI